jgi:O-antigen ligase
LRFLDVGQSAEVRIETYRQVWQMIAARPWLGYGGGAFEQAFGLFHQPPLVGYIWDRAHNTYLTLWVELGVLVGSLPLLALGLVLVRLAAGLVRARESWPAILAALGVLLVSAVHSTVDFSLEMQANALVLVALLAIGLGAVRPPAVAAPA